MNELVVLVDEAGKKIGTAPKATVHSANTPLHLAFSCYLFNDKGQFLLTQRAHVKKVWPGVWTNSLCGHLSPGESALQAIDRRAHFELGLKKTSSPQLILPDYRYKTPPFRGIIENEVCPVYIAVVESDLRPNPEEVEDYQWLGWPELLDKVAKNPQIYSWWFKDQLKLLNNNPDFNDFLAKF